MAALARIRPLYMEECQIVDAQNGQVAAVGQFTSSEQLEHLPSVMGEADVVVMNAPDSQVHIHHCDKIAEITVKTLLQAPFTQHHKISCQTN